MRPKIAPAPMEDINNLHADESFAAPPSHSASRGPSPQPVDCPALSALHTASGAPSHRFTLKHLRHAVTAANVLAQRLEIQIQKDKKKDFHLMLLREELVELKRNPLRCPGPTPAQRQEAWEKEKAHKARLERLQKAAENAISSVQKNACLLRNLPVHSATTKRKKRLNNGTDSDSGCRRRP